MIVSASYRTDIPAFYGAWFRNRLRAGECRVVNPWNGGVYTVSLRPGDVDGFVFWTRNLRPFRPVLPELRGLGPFVVQYTITGYPRALERAVTAPANAVADLHALAERDGRRTGVWRYDPVIVSSLTPPAWHRRNFATLAAALAGAVDEVVVSFAHIYRKTRRNLEAAAADQGLAWEDPADATKRELLHELVQVAAAHGMRFTLCTQPHLADPDLAPARCIDSERLSELARQSGHPPVRARRRGNRPGCLCAEARDIGAYDTCPHGCVYCYAVRDRALAKRRYAAHDPHSPFLLAARA